MTPWHIDALDGLSGVAFASHRRSDLIDGEPDLDLPAWFISAPGFRPEPISSRAIGFSAANRGLQLGLSVDGETEVSFPSLGVLTEYVRRLYIAGGGSDGPGGVEPGPMGPDEPPEDGPPADPEFPHEDDFPAQVRILNYASKFQTLVQNIDHEHGLEEVPELSSEGVLSNSPDSPARLGAVLVDEALSSIIQNAAPQDTRLRQACFLAAERLWKLQWALGIERDPVVLAGHGGFVLPYGARRNGQDDEDVLDTLAALPIPAEVRISGTGSETWRSLKDLFFATLADPTRLVDARFPQKRTTLFLLAASAIAHQRRNSEALGILDPRPWDFHQVLMEDTFNWLKPQLPKVAFSKQIEATIQSLSDQPPPDA